MNWSSELHFYFHSCYFDTQGFEYLKYFKVNAETNKGVKEE